MRLPSLFLRHPARVFSTTRLRKMPNYINLINAVDSVSPDFDLSGAGYYKLLLPNDPRPHGFLSEEIVSQLPWTPAFTLSKNPNTVQLNPPPATSTSPSPPTKKALATYSTTAFQSVIDSILQQNLFAHMLHGKHSEPYLIMGTSPPVTLERWPAPLFGISSRGAHMTCYVPSPSSPDGTSQLPRIWVAKRSERLFTYPGMLDTSVAGGVKADDSPFDCIIAESKEEAGLDPTFVRQHAKATGVLTYLTQGQTLPTISPTALYVFDMVVAEDVEMKPVDGEVEKFELMTVPEVVDAMEAGRFKPNCNLVMVDFFVRHGILSQENEERYVEICGRLHRRLPVPMAAEEGW